jgi:predicted dehydrogenase
VKRVIQVGFGPAGRVWYEKVVVQFPDVEVVACVDADARVRETLQGEYARSEQSWFASLTDALSSVDADIVLVTAHLQGHVPLTEEALEAGKHVLVEKPFARTVSEAARMADLAQERGLQLVVGQNYRFFPAPQTVQPLLAEGELGPISSVRVDFRHNNGFTRTADSKHARLDHPLLMDMAVHHFDLLRMLLLSDPLEVVCHTYNPPWSVYKDPPSAFATMMFPGQIPVSYRGSWVSHSERTPWAGVWEIECERGSIVWQSRLSAEDISADSVVIRRYDGEERQIPLARLQFIDRAGAFNALLQSIEGTAPAGCTGRDNVGTIAFMNAMIESAEDGKVVSLAGR